MKEYIVVDLETTGLDPYKGCEIIEIGVTEITQGKIGRNYSRLIKPKNHIPYFITEITNISDDMVENEEGIEQVLPRFREYLGDKIMIAHNAKFDLKFLNYYLEALNLEPITNYICTLGGAPQNSIIRRFARAIPQNQQRTNTSRRLPAAHIVSNMRCPAFGRRLDKPRRNRWRRFHAKCSIAVYCGSNRCSCSQPCAAIAAQAERCLPELAIWFCSVVTHQCKCNR